MNTRQMLFGVTLLLVLTSCKTTQQRPMSDADIAGRVFGLNVAAAKAVSAENFVGLVSDEAAYSRRNDSRTYVVIDGTPRAANAFYTGSDEELMNRTMTIIERLGIPLTEVSQRKILQEQGQTAQWDRAAKRIISMSAIDKGKRWVTLARKVDGVPVFSSRTVVSLNPRGAIGYAEVHWPEIPREVLAEAHRLQTLVRDGWKPPEQAATKVESVEAGIIHSPTAANVLDLYPTIRVIYTSTNPRVTKKPVLYFDGNGKVLSAPRNFRQSTELPKQGRPVKP